MGEDPSIRRPPLTLATPRKGAARDDEDTESSREPVYLASQLASICDVDLKTIHNWCDRNDDPDAPAELESFRTPGGHLRFKHSAVLRFLTRWGYPIPDPLLADRTHVLLIEPDDGMRRELIALLKLVRPGEDVSTTPVRDLTAQRHVPNPLGVAGTLGLWANPRYYVHIWNDPLAALIALGERMGAGAPPDIAVLALPVAGVNETAWMHAARAFSEGYDLRFVLVTPDHGRGSSIATDDVVSIIPRRLFSSLRAILEQQAELVQLRAAEGSRTEPLRKRRVPIAPRESIFVASQVASIWGVDLKTVHNWVERGDIEAFRTPGRHLRFRRRSLLHFLRRYNMSIPEDLGPARPQVMVVDFDAARAARIARSLAPSFEVIEQNDPVAALADLGARSAGAGLIDALVVALPAPGIDADRWLRAVAQHPDTQYTRVIVVSLSEPRDKALHELGAMATVNPDSLEQIAPVLERALGLVR